MALPLAIVRPEIVTVAPLLTSKIRLALLPLTVIRKAPGPSMVMLLVRFSWPVVSLMVPCRKGAKWMTAPEVASAAATADRKEPGPLSLRLVTSVLGTVRLSSGSKQGRKPGDRRPTAGRRIVVPCLRTNEKRDMGNSFAEEKTGHRERPWPTGARSNTLLCAVDDWIAEGLASAIATFSSRSTSCPCPQCLGRHCDEGTPHRLGSEEMAAAIPDD